MAQWRWERRIGRGGGVHGATAAGGRRSRRSASLPWTWRQSRCPLVLQFYGGNGSDLHRLEPGLPLIIDGINIPHDRGSDAYSDGDMLLHCVVDAMFVSLGLQDIGQIFRDSDPRWKGDDSLVFMKEAVSFCPVAWPLGLDSRNHDDLKRCYTKQVFKINKQVLANLALKKNVKVVASQDWPEVTKYAGFVSSQAHRWRTTAGCPRGRATTGGMPGSFNLRDCKVLKKMVKNHTENGGLYGAICAAPAVMRAYWGMLKGLKVLSLINIVGMVLLGCTESVG